MVAAKKGPLLLPDAALLLAVRRLFRSSVLDSLQDLFKLLIQIVHLHLKIREAVGQSGHFLP